MDFKGTVLGIINLFLISDLQDLNAARGFPKNHFRCTTAKIFEKQTFGD